MDSHAVYAQSYDLVVHNLNLQMVGFTSPIIDGIRWPTITRHSLVTLTSHALDQLPPTGSCMIDVTAYLEHEVAIAIARVGAEQQPIAETISFGIIKGRFHCHVPVGLEVIDQSNRLRTISYLEYSIHWAKHFSSLGNGCKCGSGSQRCRRPGSGCWYRSRSGSRSDCRSRSGCGLYCRPGSRRDVWYWCHRRSYLWSVGIASQLLQVLQNGLD